MATGRGNAASCGRMGGGGGGHSECTGLCVCVYITLPCFSFLVRCLWVIGSSEPQTVDTSGFWWQPLRRRWFVTLSVGRIHGRLPRGYMLVTLTICEDAKHLPFNALTIGSLCSYRGEIPVILHCFSFSEHFPIYASCFTDRGPAFRCCKYLEIFGFGHILISYPRRLQ